MSFILTTIKEFNTHAAWLKVPCRAAWAMIQEADTIPISVRDAIARAIDYRNEIQVMVVTRDDFLMAFQVSTWPP